MPDLLSHNVNYVNFKNGQKESEGRLDAAKAETNRTLSDALYARRTTSLFVSEARRLVLAWNQTRRKEIKSPTNSYPEADQFEFANIDQALVGQLEFRNHGQ